MGDKKDISVPIGSGGAAAAAGACRWATGAEWARSMVCVIDMQVLGKPGDNLGNLQFGTPLDCRAFFFPGYFE